MMRGLMFALLLSGCSSYKYEHVLADGSTCVLSIDSMRDFEAGGILLDKNCSLKSGASGASVNDKIYDAVNVLVGKIP